MDLNPLFTGVTAFHPAGDGGALKLFEHAGIELVHGWLSDPESSEYQILSRTRDYDTSVNLIAEADHLTKGRLLSPEHTHTEPEAGGSSGGSYDTLTHDEREKVQDGTRIEPKLALSSLVTTPPLYSNYHPGLHRQDTFATDLPWALHARLHHRARPPRGALP